MRFYLQGRCSFAYLPTVVSISLYLTKRMDASLLIVLFFFPARVQPCTFDANSLSRDESLFDWLPGLSHMPRLDGTLGHRRIVCEGRGQTAVLLFCSGVS